MENIRRVSEVAKLMVDAGHIVIISLIFPYRSERHMASSLFDAQEFIEVFIDTSLQGCEKRDVKGLYAKCRRGELKNFTRINSAYESPANPEVHLPTEDWSAEECAENLYQFLSNLLTE